MGFENAFANNSEVRAASSRGLAGTAQLTQSSTEIANIILRTVDQHYEDYKELVTQSKVDHNAMDSLINQTYPLTSTDFEFLKKLDEATLDNMLKSQQSKRSRAKGKVMTLENYTNMMVAAIAENAIRLALNKEKSVGGLRREAGIVEYDEDTLDELAADQEKLRKEIRNVQSKKSIMKSKADFNAEDPRWLSLLKAEEQLKSLRTGATATVVEVDTTKNEIRKLLSNTDASKVDAGDILAEIMALIDNPKQADSVE